MFVVYCSNIGVGKFKKRKYRAQLDFGFEMKSNRNQLSSDGITVLNWLLIAENRLPPVSGFTVREELRFVKIRNNPPATTVSSGKDR